MGYLTVLSQIALYNNQLSGTLPSSLGQLTALELIHLYSNQLTGSIPSSIGQLVRLGELWLQENKLEGTLPPEMSGLRKLRSLFLQHNLFTGYLTNVFNHSTQLEFNTIDLSNNHLLNFHSIEMFRLPQLIVLSLSGALRAICVLYTILCCEIYLYLTYLYYISYIIYLYLLCLQ